MKEIYIKASELRDSLYGNTQRKMFLHGKSPTYIPYQVLTDMVESSIGNQIVYANESNGWASSSKTYGKAVEIKYINSNTIHFNLDFELYCTGINRAIDVHFDLKFEMKNSNLTWQSRISKVIIRIVLVQLNIILSELPVRLNRLYVQTFKAPMEFVTPE